MNLLIICGPTATGKTQLAHQLAEQFNGELISADSRQVYIGMDIITGKKTQNIIQTPIHLYDVVTPNQEFSVAHFVHLAIPTIEQISSNKALPILVGGTGLYIDAIVNGIDTVVVPKNVELRKTLHEYSVAELQRQLQELSPETFSQMNHSDQYNPRRLIRKIEILNASKISDFGFRISNLDVLWIGLTADLKTLRQNIVTRVDERIEQGAVQEIKQLLAQGYSWNLPAFQAIGYQEWRAYIEEPTQEHFDRARSLWILHEQQYLKRQLTWFKRNQDIHWFDTQDLLKEEKIIAKVSEFLSNRTL